MIRPLPFLQSPITGPSPGNKCANVLIDPTGGNIPLYIELTTTQAAGHIFYVTSNAASTVPHHNGDNAVPPTVRVGGNQATVFIGNGILRYIAAVCYQNGLLDSDITKGGPYEGTAGGGGPMP